MKKRPQSRGRCVGTSKRPCGRIRVQVSIGESTESFTLLVHPTAHIGPPLEESKSNNVFTDIWGEASDLPFDMTRHAYDYKRRQWGLNSVIHDATSEESSNLEGGSVPTLKGLIQRYVGIDVSRQTLWFDRIRLSQNNKTVRSYGIGDGSAVQLYIERCPGLTRSSSAPGKKRMEVGTEREFSLRGRADFSKACPGGDFWPMPKWVFQEHPNLFAKVGSGLDNKGYPVAYRKFEEMPIYIDDGARGNCNALHQGALESSLRRIRAGFVKGFT